MMRGASIEQALAREIPGAKTIAQAPQEEPAMPDSLAAKEPAPTAQQVATATAWGALRDALAAEALADPRAFDRLTRYRSAVMNLADRYEAGQPAFTGRGTKPGA